MTKPAKVSVNGKGDDPRNVGPVFREHFPEVDWSKRPQRVCVCGNLIAGGYVVSGSKFYCSKECSRGNATLTLTPNQHALRS